MSDIRESDVWVRQGLFRREYRYVVQVGHAFVTYLSGDGTTQHREWFDKFEDWTRGAHCIKRKEPTP